MLIFNKQNININNISNLIQKIKKHKIKEKVLKKSNNNKNSLNKII